jgi:hypothetical protein
LLDHQETNPDKNAPAQQPRYSGLLDPEEPKNVRAIMAALREAALIREKVSELRSVVKIMWLSALCLFLCAPFIDALFIVIVIRT